MCGKCGVTTRHAGCGAGTLGVVFMLAAAASRLCGWSPLGLGAKSFAAAAALLLLLSISLQPCRCGGGKDECCDHHHEDKPGA